jgi:hypothetical protein
MLGAAAADIAGVVLDGFSIRPSMSGGLQAATLPSSTACAASVTHRLIVSLVWHPQAGRANRQGRSRQQVHPVPERLLRSVLACVDPGCH